MFVLGELRNVHNWWSFDSGMSARLAAVFVVLAAVASVVLVSAGTLTMSNQGTNAQGTLLRTEWTVGRFGQPDVEAPRAGPNPCEPNRDPGTASHVA